VASSNRVASNRTIINWRSDQAKCSINGLSMMEKDMSFYALTLVISLYLKTDNRYGDETEACRQGDDDDDGDNDDDDDDDDNAEVVTIIQLLFIIIIIIITSIVTNSDYE
jgi:hypothetical protein